MYYGIQLWEMPNNGCSEQQQLLHTKSRKEKPFPSLRMDLLIQTPKSIHHKSNGDVDGKWDSFSSNSPFVPINPCPTLSKPSPGAGHDWIWAETPLSVFPNLPQAGARLNWIWNSYRNLFKPAPGHDWMWLSTIRPKSVLKKYSKSLISRRNFKCHFSLSTSFSVMWRDNSFIPLGLASYGNAIFIVVCYVPDPCIPGTQGVSWLCSKTYFFKSWALSHEPGVSELLPYSDHKPGVWDSSSEDSTMACSVLVWRGWWTQWTLLPHFVSSEISCHVVDFHTNIHFLKIHCNSGLSSKFERKHTSHYWERAVWSWY